MAQPEQNQLLLAETKIQQAEQNHLLVEEAEIQ